MRCLLDTHALVWFADGDAKLSAAALATVGDPASELFVSPASFWEIAIKAHLGKWALTMPYLDYADAVFRLYGFHELPIRPDHTVRLIGLPNHHNDPFDRLLAVQALAEGLTLVSADAVFDRYGVPRVWA